MSIDGWWNHSGMILKVANGQAVCQADFQQCHKGEVVMKIDGWDGHRFTGTGKAWGDGKWYDIVGSVQDGHVNVNWPLYGQTVMYPHQ